MDPVAELGAEDVVDELVLGDAAEAGEGRTLHDRLEVVPVPADRRTSAGNSGLDPALELVWRN